MNDGSCSLLILGCLTEDAYNYDSTATRMTAVLDREPTANAAAANTATALCAAAISTVTARHHHLSRAPPPAAAAQYYRSRHHPFCTAAITTTSTPTGSPLTTSAAALLSMSTRTMPIRYVSRAAETRHVKSINGVVIGRGQWACAAGWASLNRVTDRIGYPSTSSATVGARKVDPLVGGSNRSATDTPTILPTV